VEVKLALKTQIVLQVLVFLRFVWLVETVELHLTNALVKYALLIINAHLIPALWEIALVVIALLLLELQCSVIMMYAPLTLTVYLILVSMENVNCVIQL
jgi:hypothetical protein